MISTADMPTADLADRLYAMAHQGYSVATRAQEPVLLEVAADRLVALDAQVARQGRRGK